MEKNWRGWVPIFNVKDARKSIEFYCDKLGFNKDWEHQFAPDFPIYASVSRDQCTLHINEHGDDTPTSTMVVSIADVDAAYAEMCANEYIPPEGPEDRPYGTRDFTITDPDGNQLILSQPLSNFDTAPGRTNGETAD